MKRIPVGHNRFALVDDADFERVSEHSWRTPENGYPITTIQRRTVLLHRLILDAPPGVEVDHRDGDQLDARREKLRLCSRVENMRNSRKHTAKSSAYKGVSWNTQHGRWRATLGVENRRVHLGSFRSELAAALAYDSAALELFGEFARLNFPLELRKVS